jgi:hypothetical protein
LVALDQGRRAGHIDTTTSSGKLILHAFYALGEFEREVRRVAALAVD